MGDFDKAALDAFLTRGDLDDHDFCDTCGRAFPMQNLTHGACAGCLADPDSADGELSTAHLLELADRILDGDGSDSVEWQEVVDFAEAVRRKLRKQPQ
jgi:hypothetical protein